jgi:hypothetical protein
MSLKVRDLDENFEKEVSSHGSDESLRRDGDAGIYLGDGGRNERDSGCCKPECGVDAQEIIRREHALSSCGREPR